MNPLKWIANTKIENHWIIVFIPIFKDNQSLSFGCGGINYPKCSIKTNYKKRQIESNS